MSEWAPALFEFMCKRIAVTADIKPSDAATGNSDFNTRISPSAVSMDVRSAWQVVGAFLLGKNNTGQSGIVKDAGPMVCAKNPRKLNNLTSGCWIFGYSAATRCTRHCVINARSDAGLIGLLRT